MGDNLDLLLTSEVGAALGTESLIYEIWCYVQIDNVRIEFNCRTPVSVHKNCLVVLENTPESPNDYNIIILIRLNQRWDYNNTHAPIIILFAHCILAFSFSEQRYYLYFFESFSSYNTCTHKIINVKILSLLLTEKVIFQFFTLFQKSQLFLFNFI